MTPAMSDEDLQQKAGEEVWSYVRELRVQVETHKARADAAVINSEQNCSLIEQKFLSLTAQFSQIEHEKEQSIATLERRSGELALVQAQAHKLELDAIKHSSDLERVSFELEEVRKSRRDLLDVVEQKNAELDEKNASIKSYLDKIVSLTDERSTLIGKYHEHDAELVRSHAMAARLQQEKDLLEQHNSWLNKELTAKVNNLMEDRRTSAELEADLQLKLTQVERRSKAADEALHRSKDRVKDLETKLSQAREELRFTNEQAVLQEDHLSAEVATATKLADLYKESADEWSNKCTELEGVIKALETHLKQVESDYRDKLDTEIQAREALAKEAADAKENLDKILADRNREAERGADGFTLPGSRIVDFTEPMDRQLAVELHGEGAIIPAAAGISGTALAAALLRDGWSLSQMYAKYQDAVDAWRHERHERKQSQSVLERVLREIEVKAEFILEERAEHVKMIESYHIMEEKLHYSMEEQGALENSIKDLKADLRKKEREAKGAQKEIADLQIQVAGLLKECAEVKQRFEAGDWQQNGDGLSYYATSEPDISESDIVISEKLVSFKDIRGMVEQNSQLRVLVRNLAQGSEQKESEMKEFYSAELDRRAEAAASKVVEVMRQYKEKEDIIKALQGTVAMYKRLYEDELTSRYASHDQLKPGTDSRDPDDSGKDYSRLLGSSQEEIRAIRQETATHIQSLEQELAKMKLEMTNARIAGARVEAEGAVAKDQVVSLTKEAENRRKEMDEVLVRSMEFSRTITNYQQLLRESSQKQQAAEELANKLRIEVSILEKEKELLATAEKRASEEVGILSDRAHRLQASLDTVQSVEEARENSRTAEVKKLQDDWGRMQREWTEARKELELERKHSRDLTVLRDKAVKDAMDRVEAVSKELADALKAMSAAETRAQVAEVRLAEVEVSLKKADDKIVLALTGGKRAITEVTSTTEIDAEILSNLQEVREELQQVKEDLVAAKGHTEQYKRIAEANEEALKQLETAHNSYKADVGHMKEVMEADTRRLRNKLVVLEAELTEKESASGIIIQEKDIALKEAERETATLKESLLSSQSALQEAEVKVTTLKLEVDKYHNQWQDSQRNYERQVLLQADTIRELTVASKRVEELHIEEGALRIRAESAEAQLASLQVSWAMEKSCFESSKRDAEKNVKDLEEQNRLLLDRVEALHIMSAEHSGNRVGSATSEEKSEDNLQNVIRYLRRSKETAETEVSLLKQERLRLQKQLDAALHAVENSRSTLRQEQENARACLFSEEEFKSLQAQVREINLMRESNAQLREENRRNFEDSRLSREKVRQAQADLEPIKLQLREKEVELEGCRKELELQRKEVDRWQNRVSQLLEKYKTIDVEEYQRLKSELSEVQEHFARTQAELEVAKGEAEVAKREAEATRNELLELHDESIEKERRLNEQDKKLQDAMQGEASLKGELERFRRHATFLKRKLENIGKEKEDVVRENDALSKQMEELKGTCVKKPVVEARQESARQESTIRQEAAARLDQANKESDNLLKEREARIQILEKTLDRERESVRKEKMLRQRDQKTFYDVAQKAVQEKKKFLDELELFKREKSQQVEKLGSAAGSRDLSSKLEIEERAVTYLAAVNAISEVADGVLEHISAPPAVVSFPVLGASVNHSDTAQLSSSDVSATGTALGSSVVATNAVVIPSAAALLVSTSSPASVSLSASTIATVITASVVNATVSSTATVGSTAVVATTMTTSVSRPPVRPVSSGISSSVIRPPSRPLPIQGVAPWEREMAQLRAQIQEKEKSQASVSQARKTARRLIRPRIEPEVVTELGEIMVEGPIDATEADVETEDTKLSTHQSDTAEQAFTPGPGDPQMAIMTALAVDNPLLPELPASNVTSAHLVAGVRKRSALVTEVHDDMLLESGKSESAPPQKKPRAVEESVWGFCQESSLVVRSAIEDRKLHGEFTSPDIVELDSVPPEMPGSDVTPNPPATQDPLVPVESSPELERDRNLMEPLSTEALDNPPQKRPRFFRPEGLSPPQVPGKDKGVLDEDVLVPKKLLESDYSGQETGLSHGKGETEVSVTRAESSVQEEQKSDLGNPSISNEPFQTAELYGRSNLPAVSGNVEDHLLGLVTGLVGSNDPIHLSQSGMEISIEENTNNQINLEDETQSIILQAPSSTVGVDTLLLVPESDVSVSDPGMQSATAAPGDGSGAEDMQDGEDDVEDGEISVDPGAFETLDSGHVANNTAWNVEKQRTEEGTYELKSQDAVSSPSGQNTGEAAYVENQANTSADIVPLVTTRTGTSEVIYNVASPVDTVSQEQKVSEEQQSELSSIVTRQLRSSNSSANTTIHLAERARERAALRKGAVNPPSPVGRIGRGRGTRGGKRAPGSSRGGRVISTGIRGRGQAGVPPSEATRTTQQGVSIPVGPLSQPDQVEELNTTANPFETLPREAED